MESHPTCARHDSLAEQVQLSKAIVDAIPGMMQRLDQHMLGEGHPLLTQKLDYMKEDHKRNTQLLEKLVETVTVACQSIKQLQEDRNTLKDDVKAHAERLAVTEKAQAVAGANWKTTATVAMLVLGNVVGLVFNLLKR